MEDGAMKNSNNDELSDGEEGTADPNPDTITHADGPSSDDN